MLTMLNSYGAGDLNTTNEEILLEDNKDINLYMNADRSAYVKVQRKNVIL
jgi:hypothetical protein